MRAATVAALFIALGSVALAKEPPAYEKAVLVKTFAQAEMSTVFAAAGTSVSSAL